MDDMSNEVALGYMIMAAKEIGLDKETIKKLESEMKYSFDMFTYERAKDTYMKFI